MKPCTCHPDERPYPCQHKYAFSDCMEAARLRSDLTEKERAEALRIGRVSYASAGARREK